MEIVIYPYKMGSASGKRLAESMDALRVYPDRTYRPKSNHLVINWGNGIQPKWDGDHFTFLNRPEKVMNAINKMTSFRLFRQGKVRHPPYTTDREMAEQWIAGGDWVVCRQELEGLDGSGLVLAKTSEELVPARLYTKYVANSVEFRAYVFMGQLVTVFDKGRIPTNKLEPGVKVDPDIRTGSRGWVFCQDPTFVPKDLGQQAALAIRALGLDFGGVDVIYSKKEGVCYCLEVNTAPDIRDTTVSLFKDAIEEYAKSLG